MSDAKWRASAEKVRQSKTYLADRKFLLDAIITYKNVKREKTYELHDFFTNYANEHNWGGVRLYTLLHDIVVIDIKDDPSYSTDIHDLLENYLDSLSGWCSPSSWTVLKNTDWYFPD